MRQGFVKLPRSLAESEAWGYGATVRGILATLFLDAAWRPMNVRGVHLERGEYLASVAYLAKDTGLSSKTVRIALSRLADAGVITMHSEGKKGTRITICDYDTYEETPQPKGEQSSQQSSQQSTHNRRSKEVEEGKKDPPVSPQGDNGKSSRSRFKPPEPSEVTTYARSIDFDLDGSQFCDWYASKGWMIGKNKMKDWKAAVRTWKAKSDRQTGRGKTLDELMAERTGS